MQVFSDISLFEKAFAESIAHTDRIKRTAVAVGKFDGLHAGHRELLNEVLAYREQGFSTLVFTFDSPIADFFTGQKSPVLTTNAEKEEYLRELGFDYEIVFPVNAGNLAIEPYEFVKKVLVDGLHAGMVAAGSDLSFGKDGAGDLALLKHMADVLGFVSLTVDKVMLDGEEISSTRVRKYVTDGDMEYAGRLLGHAYSIDGRVRHGRKIGRTLEMPTINLEPETEKLLPPFGVYYSDIIIGTERYHGITNIGIKPTVTDEAKTTVETYIFDFDDDLYGEILRVELLHYHRSEQKFPDIIELKKQMHDDMLKGRAYFGSVKGGL